MKRLIVLTVSTTLLALLSGCSILGGRGVQSCDTTSPAPARLSRLKLTNLLPWRRGPAECQTCNEGIHESRYIDGGHIDGQIINGGIIGGSYEGEIINESPYTGFSTGFSTTERLYHPEVVGPPILESAPSSRAHTGELVATPPHNP